MALRAKKEEVVEETVEETATPKKGKKTEVTVKFQGTERVFSLKVHGEDFADLAEEFATKHRGEIV